MKREEIEKAREKLDVIWGDYFKKNGYSYTEDILENIKDDLLRTMLAILSSLKGSEEFSSLKGGEE